jgi:hypothetical protein
MFAAIKDYFVAQKFMRTPLAQALRQHTQDYLHGDTVLRDFRQDNKEKFVAHLMSEIGAAFQSPNPALAVRERIVAYTIQYADLQVLALNEAEKPQMFYAENPHISGELHGQIDAAAEHVDELAKFQWQGGEKGQDLIDFCNVRCAIYLYYMNAFNMARNELGDKTDPDWFRPLVEAQLVYAENTIREKMGLPLTTADMIDALAYWIMAENVVQGIADPYYEWCKAFPDKYLAGRGPHQS